MTSSPVNTKYEALTLFLRLQSKDFSINITFSLSSCSLSLDYNDDLFAKSSDSVIKCPLEAWALIFRLSIIKHTNTSLRLQPSKLTSFIIPENDKQDYTKVWMVKLYRVGNRECWRENSVVNIRLSLQYLKLPIIKMLFTNSNRYFCPQQWSGKFHTSHYLWPQKRSQYQTLSVTGTFAFGVKHWFWSNIFWAEKCKDEYESKYIMQESSNFYSLQACKIAYIMDWSSFN